MIVGKSTPRIEDMDLVRGKARFVGDIQFPDILLASFVRSPHAHARIDSIDRRAALELPGVVAVLTSHDIRGIAESDRLHVALPDRTYKQQRDRLFLRLMRPSMSAKRLRWFSRLTPTLLKT